MSYRFIKVEKKQHLSIITINRPEVLNSLHPPACQELDEAFNEFSTDPEAWVAILTAAGEKAFCAGNDLKWQAEHGGEAVREGLKALKGGFGGITRRFDCFKPFVAAVNGFALGGGLELALACDIIIAAEHATFGLPEPRVGMIAGAGGVHRLPRQIPYHLAMGLLLTGRRITAREALQTGLLNEVVPAQELMPTAERWAAEIVECAPLALRACKGAVLQGLELSLEKAVDTEFKEIIDMRQSEDFTEGPRAFAQKRKPQWKGR
jgi:enoyl-CoA hydratase/carnithine racemase